LSGKRARISDQRKENSGSEGGPEKLLFRRVKSEGPSLHLCNIETRSGGHSNGAVAAGTGRRGVAPASRRFSLHGFKRICQANDHNVMVTKHVLLRH
jgi:hypothetical protein